MHVDQPITMLSPSELTDWLSTRYIPSAIDPLLADPRRSAVVLTYAGCGLTTSLFLLAQRRLLTFPYNPPHWPGEPQALTKELTHFGQWMSHIAYRLVERLRGVPEVLGQLADYQIEFLIWLTRRYLGRRQSSNWRQFLSARLPAEVWMPLGEKSERGELDQLYSDTVLDMSGQIDECLEVAQLLGWDGIYACVELNWGDWVLLTPEARARQMEGLESLLGTLTPLQRPGLGLKAGVPQELLDQEAVARLVRGRAVVTRIQWPEATLLDLAARELRHRACAPYTGLAGLWQALMPDIISIWGRPGPAAALALAGLIADHSPGGLDPEHLIDLRARLYRQAARLRLDGDHGQRQVWRGMQAIKLDETPFSFLNRLWRARGHFVASDELLLTSGSQASLDKNVSRVRKSIEPLAAEQRWLYLKRTQADGVWLDKDLCAFDK